MHHAMIIPDRTTILTIGYEKSDVARFTSRLVEAGVDVLVDVRDVPQSRKPGFSKKALQANVEAAGISYVHVKALGDPKPGREAARSGQHDLFVSIFRRHLESPEAAAALEVLVRDMKGKRFCLACFERSHEACHRSLVAAALEAATGAPVVHLAV